MNEGIPLNSRTLAKIMNQYCYSVDQRHQIHIAFCKAKDWKEFLKWLVIFKKPFKRVKPNYYLKR